MSGCPSTSGTADPGGGGTTSTCSSVTAEINECTSTISPGSSPVIITGKAQFYKRTLRIGTYMTLSTPIVSPMPIKYAEVRVLDSKGAIVQCGTTDSTGDLKAVDGTSSLQIPNTSGDYKIQVLARSNHTLTTSKSVQYHVSVKKDVCSNTVQSISKTVTSSGSSPISLASSDLTATAKESESSDIPGGAFNIYNDLLTTYDYLLQNTGTSDISCLNPKLNVYWLAGFNPAQYLYPNEAPSGLSNISFYLRGYNELYINGGKLGDVKTADTDHFDDAVIIHELGHHVEDVCGKMDSPGGTHNGLFRIDPRLAWSEGWGNFMGANVVHNSISSINSEIVSSLPSDGWTYYLDTNGYDESNSDNATYELIRLTLNKPGNNPDRYGGYYYDKVDATNNPGEGHFREVSIARSLYKTTNTCTTYCTNQNYMPLIWKAFENSSSGIGMGKSTYTFRSSVRFYNRLAEVFSNDSTLFTPVDNILNTDEAQQRDGNSQYVSGGNDIWPPYAIKLVSSGSSADCTQPLMMEPKTEAATVTNNLSDQRYSNHFFLVDMNNLPGVTAINLSATKTAGVTNINSFDLILYTNSYTYVPEVTCDAYSNCTKNTTSSQFVRSDLSGSSLTRSISSLNSIGGGTAYLLDVRAYTYGRTIGSGTTFSYTLKDQNGVTLCPSSTF